MPGKLVLLETCLEDETAAPGLCAAPPSLVPIVTYDGVLY